MDEHAAAEASTLDNSGLLRLAQGYAHASTPEQRDQLAEGVATRLTVDEAGVILRAAAAIRTALRPPCLSHTAQTYVRSVTVRRTTVLPAALLAAALLALTACSTEPEPYAPAAGPATSAPAAEEPAEEADSGESSDAEKAAGIPDAPTGAALDAYLAAIRDVDPAIVEDEEKAIDAGRNQCSHLAAPNDKSDWLAAQRFGNDARPLTDAQGKALNAALRATLCPA
ncbi:hypothetical protein [Streptomyces microflavus]|uniref:hypothetical protein n=1 Tax=Streptomyces microflavus TaxID=1919 RepID=UPI0003A0FBF4|nr:hypothetical protein [Streptomyces microflavus]